MECWLEKQTHVTKVGQMERWLDKQTNGTMHCGLRGAKTGTKMPYDNFFHEVKYIS